MDRVCTATVELEEFIEMMEGKMVRELDITGISPACVLMALDLAHAVVCMKTSLTGVCYAERQRPCGGNEESLQGVR